MTASHVRGHKVTHINGVWLYADSLSAIDDARPCVRCCRPPTAEGFDACLGEIPSTASACCGHGVAQPIAIAARRPR